MRRQLPPRVVRAALRVAVRPALRAPLPVPVQRVWLRAAGSGGVQAPGVTRDPGLLGARPAEIHTPVAATGRAILYLHGGAFTLGDPVLYRALGSHLASAASARVHVLHYRRAPEHRYPAALDDALDAWDDLRSRGLAAEDLAVVGDSAGGWLALATALRLRDRGSGPLGPLGLISPWVDLTVPPGDWATDDLLSQEWLTRSASMFLAGTDHADPRVDLTRAGLRGLPRTTLHVGADEALLGDARTLAGRLRAEAVDLRYAEFPGLWHVAQAQAGSVEAATAAVRVLGDSLWG